MSRHDCGVSSWTPEVEIVDKVDLALDHPLKTSSAKAKVLEMLESKPLGGTLKALKNSFQISIGVGQNKLFS